MTPNLFILGAAKCGTTSLHSILGQHPEIHANWLKEPTFFNWPFQVVRNPIGYFKLFESPKKYRMDSSTAYLVNAQTAQVLHSLFPDARFIVSLRDPKARAYSHYRDNRRAGYEPMTTFMAALEAEERRFASIEFIVQCPHEFWNFQYCYSTQYDQHLIRYFALFDRSQFCVVTLADLAKRPVATVERILRFLELDPSPASTFDYTAMNRNETREPYDADADRFMSAAFNGLTERTDTLVGRALDWSM